jgi:hypothetical protein
MKTSEFEIGDCNDYTIFIELILDFCSRNGKEITCYTPDAEKNTITTLARDWKGKGFKFSKNIYKSLLEEISVEKQDFQ